jgi:hypothetical protein
MEGGFPMAKKRAMRIRRGAQQEMSRTEEDIERFKASYPKVAEALRLFGLSDQAYQRAMASLYEPRIRTLSSTGGLLDSVNNMGPVEPGNGRGAKC